MTDDSEVRSRGSSEAGADAAQAEGSSNAGADPGSDPAEENASGGLREPKAGSAEAVIRAAALRKTYRIGFLRKKVEAVKGIDFEVRSGEVFGLLGPNGAGKTTTIRMILRLIFPSSGSIALFGDQRGNPESMRRLGYMPENPYLYQHLRPMELLDLCGRLMGMSGTDRRTRSEIMIERVGLTHAFDRPIGRFSKGMMQRMGLAQALLHDPELLVLDEPMSGLDPVGRREVRELLLEERRRGKTLLFTSHILTDVEMLCDRVVILRRGKVLREGTVNELLAPVSQSADIELRNVSAELDKELRQIAPGRAASLEPNAYAIEGDAELQVFLKAAMEGNAEVVSVVPRRQTLEHLFIDDGESKESTGRAT